MKDAIQLEVKQVRIFPIDSLPIVRLMTPPVAQAFKERFVWGGVSTEEGKEGADVVFQPGLFPANDGKDSIVISSLQMNDRRIVISVRGDTRDTNRVYEGLVAFLRETAGWSVTDPLILTEETTCVATLGFDWTSLLSPELVSFAQGPLLDMVSQEGSRPQIKGLRLSFAVTYPDAPPRLREHGVTLGDKLVTIEPRVSTALAERRFFTHSPSDSGTHRKLLDRLEQTLAGTKAGRKAARGGRR